VRASVRVVWLVVVVVAIGVLTAACGSSSKSSASSGPATTISPNTPCPFSGSTASQSQPGASSATTLNQVTPSTAGCVDNVTFGFSPTLAPSVSAYETTAPSGGGAVLVVTLQHTTLGGGLKPGTKLNPKNVNYVSQVQLTSSSGNVVWNITLDKKRPFLVSSSQVPAQLVIAVG
jgi:hypothetical protein